MNIDALTKNQWSIYRFFALIVVVLLITPMLYAQAIEVNGSVKDAGTQEPLIGVTLLVKGTSQGTVTDFDGNFTLNVENGQEVEVRYVGYQVQTIAYTGQATLDILLEEDVEILNEVVVIGFGVQKKSDLSGSVTSVKSEQLTDIAAADVISSLKGKAAGVLVSSSGGAPGDAPKILIRGASSINASNQPLYIIDGVSGSIQDINQQDIESMEILKDAASTAIYGAAGANGVVLITTKQGKKGKMSVNFSIKQGVQLKVTPIELLTSEEQFDLVKELNPDIVEHFYDGSGHDSLASTKINTSSWEDVNWQDEIMQNASFQEYNLSLSGGNDKTKFLISGLYRQNEGIIKTASANQFVFRVNLLNQLTKKLSITSNLNISQRNQNPVADNTQSWNGALINASFTYPNFIPIYDPNNPDHFMVNPLRPQFDNPQAWIRGKDENRKSTRISGLLQLQWQIGNAFTFISRNSINNSTGSGEKWLNPNDTYNGRGTQGEYQISFRQSLSIGTQNTLTFVKDIGKNSFTTMGGIILSTGNNQRNWVKGTNFPNDYLREIGNAEKRDGSSGHGESFSAAYVGRLTYAYNHKYLAQFNIRADGSPFFGENNRWATFPSASLAWKISEEPFFSNVKAINFLKLRLSYGLSGNKPSENFKYMATYSSQGAAYGDGNYPMDLNNALTAGYSIANGENQDLKWETTKETNIGLDMHLLEDRIIFNADLYKRNAYDLLYIFEPPVTFYDYGTGSWGGLLLNIANTSNQGVELGVSSRNLVGAFKWSTDLAFAYNENEVVSLGDNPVVNYDERQVITPGYALNAFWGYEMDRLFQVDDFSDGERILKDGIPEQANVRPGDIKFKDINGDGVVDKDDKVYLGNPVPPITYGLTNNFEYKNFDLTVFLQGVQGNKIWNRTRESTESMNNYLQQFATVRDRWTPENTDTDMPRAVLGDPAKNTRKSDRYIEDGSYFRVKDIVLGYNLAKTAWLEKMNISQARIYFSAQNLYTLTNYSGYDPEVRAVDFSGYPQNKTFVIGANFSF